MLRGIYIASFIFSFSVALTTYINSSLLGSFLNEKLVSITYVLASLISLFALGKVPNAIQKIGARKMILGLLTINIASSLLLILAQEPYLKMLGFFAFFSSIPLSYFCFDLFIEHFSKSNNTGTNRGAYLLAVNTGWFLAPLIAGEAIKNGGFSWVYHLAQGVVLVAIIFIYSITKKYQDVTYSRAPLLETLKSLRLRPEIKNAILLNFLIQFFYACMVIYIPIHLVNYFNLDWGYIGLIFSVMLSAFVIFQYPTGLLTDRGAVKNTNALFGSLLIMCLSLVLIYLLKSPSTILIIGGILFLSRIGAAIYEASVEYFFFKNTNDSDTNYISLFRDVSPLAYIIAPIFGSLILKTNSIQGIFLALSIFMFIVGTITIIKIKRLSK